ncbi:hypothetical protein GNI_008140 [Gregarina niphandrodes]|uniref:Uncharacterized protein n=1 Tax=Gregarina niphandrodes TaxID=110365 RepID=A0A023BD35_GRENI|nr:hypothetical protein GNI_008140 [Gregarina niphandrodes]EZG87103.1 hypothetical protein GNI_008140 [Gregarina niphandrodes]|eukprot:XP_011128700.1 hypothetical protein GNI_008140 [Gregarina niphandrodes]
MVLLDFGLKDTYIQTTQTQNLGRLLNSVCREAQDVIKDIAERSQTQELSVGSNLRQDLWERVRVLRELYLKCVVLVGAAMWDARETVRRRAQEFFEIQWPPMGAFPPPQPPWALTTAVNVLTGANPRTLPKYAQLAVEQCSSNAVDAVRNIRLPLIARKRIGRRLTSIIRSDYALALSESRKVETTLNFVTFKLEMGRVHLESQGEFQVTFLTDFRHFQFERFRVSVGEGLGYGVSPELDIMGGNTLQSACNVVIETVENLKSRALYEVNSWKALINASKETREKARDLRVLARWLALSDKTTIQRDQLDQILERDPFQAVLQAGTLEADKNKLTTNLDIHRDENDHLFEEAEAEGKKEDVSTVQLDDLTRQLYQSLWRMEKLCIDKLVRERKEYRSIEGGEFTLEFYRFIVLLAARIARYSALLILRDQARNMCRCTAAPGGVIYVREWKENRPKRTKQKTTRWAKLFKKYFPTPPTEGPSLAEEGDDSIPFACLFPPNAMPTHTDYVDIDFLPGLPQALFEAALGSTHTGICRLTFGLDQAQAELFVQLEPLHGLIQQFMAPEELVEEQPEKQPLVQNLPATQQPEEQTMPVEQQPVIHHNVQPTPTANMQAGNMQAGSVPLVNNPAGDMPTGNVDLNVRDVSAENLRSSPSKSSPFRDLVEQGGVRLRGTVGEEVSTKPKGATKAEKRANLQRVVRLVARQSQTKYFYVHDETLAFQTASSSTVRGFGGMYLDLTMWISTSCDILAFMALEALSCLIGKWKDWSSAITGLHLELSYCGRRSVKIWMDLLTGHLCVDPTNVGTRLTENGVSLSVIAHHTALLAGPLNEGEIDTFLTELERLESISAPPVLNDRLPESIELISEDEHAD